MFRDQLDRKALPVHKVLQEILVLQDLLGMNPQFKPKFLRHYADGRGMITDAINRFHEDTRSGEFPTQAESYH